MMWCDLEHGREMCGDRSNVRLFIDVKLSRMFCKLRKFFWVHCFSRTIYTEGYIDFLWLKIFVCAIILNVTKARFQTARTLLWKLSANLNSNNVKNSCEQITIFWYCDNAFLFKFERKKMEIAEILFRSQLVTRSPF